MESTPVESESTSGAVAIGVDLGTTRTVASYVDSRGKIHRIPNCDGEVITPSAVYVEDGQVVVGREAIKANANSPQCVATFAKREMGRENYSRDVDGITFPPEWIQAMILRRVYEDAERFFGHPINRAVVTVPAYFNESRRRRTRDAAWFAGFKNVAIINEPTAAAIAYSVRKHAYLLGNQRVLVYDLGGGTFDVTLAKVTPAVIRIRATDGNAMLGGLDWDRCLADWLNEQFVAKHGVAPSETLDGDQMLLHFAEEVKHSLSRRPKVPIRIPFARCTLETSVTRELFSDLTAHLTDRTRFTMTKLMRDVGYRWEQIDQVLLVGGSTKMRDVRDMIRRESGLDPNDAVSGEGAVSEGAALFAAKFPLQCYSNPHATPVSIAQPNIQIGETEIHDVTRHSLGVLAVETKTGRRKKKEVIASQSPIPAKQTVRFFTAREGQPSVVVEVIEGGDQRGRYASRIGICTVDRLPASLPEKTPVDVQFYCDRDGLIRVQASLPTIGKSHEVVIDRDYESGGENLERLAELQEKNNLQLAD